MITKELKTEEEWLFIIFAGWDVFSRDFNPR